MNNKDKFLMFLSLICLPFGALAAEQTGTGLSSPINQEVLQNIVKITGPVSYTHLCQRCDSDYHQERTGRKAPHLLQWLFFSAGAEQILCRTQCSGIHDQRQPFQNGAVPLSRQLLPLRDVYKRQAYTAVCSYHVGPSGIIQKRFGTRIAV